MGSPPGEVGRVDQDEAQHHQRISHGFAISSKEITIEEYGRFVKDIPRYATDHGNEVVRSQKQPELSVTWFDAAAYCNWLSLREGLTEKDCCYEPNSQGIYDEGMKIKQDYTKLRGYRLPTDDEWEYACRAGSATPYYFGYSTGILGRYAGFYSTSYALFLPVGQRIPNDLGLFDIIGNAREWVQDKYISQHIPTELASSAEEIIPGNDHRILRGGSSLHDETSLRSAYRKHNPPSDEDNGFRIARTAP
jgi:eukaryotic-like serine/threonine-protein kinase